MFRSSLEMVVIAILATLGGLYVSLPRFDGFGTGNEQAQVETPDPVEPTEAESVEPEPETESPESPEQAEAPVIDVLRFNGKTGVVSGKATPGAELVIRDGDTVIATTQADNAGNFAASFDYETPEDGAILQLVQVDENGVETSARTALTVLPLEGGETATAELTEDGVKVDAPLADELALGEMRYGSATPWSLSGSAEPGANVDIFVDGEKIGSAKADQDGRWSYENQGVQPGTYELGLSQNGGEPITQSITLSDGEAEVAASSGSSDAGRNVTVGDREYVVRRGDSLWRIAERYYGEGQGYRYTEIFDTNSGKIRNPDLIYPEQEFEIPKGQ